MFAGDAPLDSDTLISTDATTMKDQALRVLGYTFENQCHLEIALTHASSADHRLASNERMEFLGDAILGYVICEHLFEKYPDLLEGEMTKIKSLVVSRRVCSEISEQIDLTPLLTLGKGMATQDGPPQSVKAAVLESIIAAIYLDGGIEPARRFILEQFEPYVRDAADCNHQSNFKSLLQQYAQRHLTDSPRYVLLDEQGPDHSKCFEVCVEIGGKRHESAWANAKKLAEQDAALHALKGLGVAIVDPQTGQIQIDVSHFQA